MKGYVMPAVLLMCMCTFAETKVEKIRILLDLTGTEKTVEVMKTQFVNIVKETDPNVSPALLDSLFRRMNIDGLYAISVPIYDKHLDEETIDGLIEFYKTKAGREFVRKMPVIMQESMQAGAQWGQRIMLDVLKELRGRGFDVDDI